MVDRDPSRKTKVDPKSALKNDGVPAPRSGQSLPADAMPSRLAHQTNQPLGDLSSLPDELSFFDLSDEFADGELKLAPEYQSSSEAVDSDDAFAGLPAFADGLPVTAASSADDAVHEEKNAVSPTAIRLSQKNVAASLTNQSASANDQQRTVIVVKAVPVIAPEQASEVAEAELLPTKRWSDRLLMRSVPSWLISMILHIAILMTLAAVQIEPVRDAIGVLMTATAGDEVTGLEENFDISGPELDVPAAAVEKSLSTPSDFAAQELALPDSTSLSPMNMSVDVGKIGNLVENILPNSALNASAVRLSTSLSGRSIGSRKSELLERFGGSAASEKSVALALKWISEHQDRSGGWSFGHSRFCRGQCKDDGDIPQATNAATALALLPYLGAGQTHLEGNYKTTVHNGLKYLISRMKVTGGELPMGSWHEDGGRMYSHGLASIVVCEAYAMTRDPDLLQPAQLAINYIVNAQDPRGGGWRYEPKEAGDTSVVGWQLMAMKSGAMGNLTVPVESFRKANSFLDSMSVNNGAYYGYDIPTSNIENRHSTTAVGLLCRMYLGWSKDKPGLQEGVKFLSERGPSVDDVYYSYYATQVMRQHGGEEWNKWNAAMRDGLIKAQVAEGHAAGSWYSPAGHNGKGGRLYCTAMSAMILEVYYRHMPLYSDKSAEDEFEF